MRPIVPPPVQGMLAVAGIWALSHWFPEYNMDFKGQRLVAGLLMACGVTIDLVALGAFRRASTTVNPLKPAASTALVTSGLYRYSRNPMYVGMALILSGFVFAFGTPLGFIVLFIFIASITYTQILPEETALKNTFGEAFAAYCQNVRRWI